MCKWGCDGLSALPNYKQHNGSENSTDYKNVFMSSLVPLRLRVQNTGPSSSSKAYEDIWVNSTPGSKNFCRPISFEFTKENKDNTKNLVKNINKQINDLTPICIKIEAYSINISFDMCLTMIDGKVSNAITSTPSYWHCSICGDKKSDFASTSKQRTINKEVLSFGISPLHARIRFLEHFLHIAYDLKYRSIPGNENTSARMNHELVAMRASEKSRIQDEFKKQTGLIIDKPLPSNGNTNDGNTARRFFDDCEITSAITGIDMELLRTVNILLMAVNSKQKINSAKFGLYSKKIEEQLISLYPWKEMTPTVHKVLCHGQTIMEFNILPLGELSEEAQEARNRDFRHIQLFNSRKSSRYFQNEDIFNNLMLSSDPVLASIRKQWFCYRNLNVKTKIVSNDFLDLLDMNTPDTSDYFTKIN